MGTILKYVIYALVIFAVYFWVAGLYKGNQYEGETLDREANELKTDAEDSVRQGYISAKEAVQNGVNLIDEETREIVQGQ